MGEVCGGDVWEKELWGRMVKEDWGWREGRGVVIGGVGMEVGGVLWEW